MRQFFSSTAFFFSRLRRDFVWPRAVAIWRWGITLLVVFIFAMTGSTASPAFSQTADDYPPPLDVPAAASDEELEKAVSDFWECVLADNATRMEELASVIERTGIERKDPYLQARGLARRAWADIHNGNWKNRSPKKLAHARVLTAEPPGPYERNVDYVIARAETLLFHGGLKNVFGFPGEPKGEVDIRDGLALSWQTGNNDLLFFAHAFAFRAEFIRNRAISCLFLVVKAEHYAEMAGHEGYRSSARCMRVLTYKCLMLKDTEEWKDLIEDTLQNFSENSSAWRKANDSKSKLDEETVNRCLAIACSPDSKKSGSRFNVEVASEIVNSHLCGDVTEETLTLAEVMVQQSKEAKSEHSLFYSIMKKAEVLARLGRDEKFFDLANEYYPKYMKAGDYFLAERMAMVARLRAELASTKTLQAEWRKKSESAKNRLKAVAIPQVTTAAQIAIQQDESMQKATKRQVIHAQKQLEAEHSSHEAKQLALRHQADLQTSRATSVIWGSLALISVLLGTTTTFFVRSRTLASRRAELEFEIEERIRAEEDLRKAQQENIRHQRLNALGEMAAGVAHDANNSLSPIRIFSSMMAREDFSKEKIKHFAQTIENCVVDATTLIQKLHPFYRKSFEDRHEVDVSEIVAQVADTTRAQLGNREIVIREEVTAFSFVCSATDIREVLINLINNSIDAIKGAGEISIRAELKDQKLILEVEDNGQGMDDKTTENCHFAFFSTKKERGSGLGLATTSAVVESYQGKIEIESEFGKGTLFRILLPGASPSEPRLEKSEEPEIPQRYKVVVVDDNIATRESVHFMLESKGHTVTSCESGYEALQRLSEEHVDLVLADYKMPGMNGYELCKQIRVLYPAINTIIMTGFEEPGLREVCDAFLTKPMSPGDVQRAITEASETR